MNMRRDTARREEEGVANERIPLCVNKVPIGGQENVKEAVPSSGTSRYPKDLKCLLHHKLLFLKGI